MFVLNLSNSNCSLVFSADDVAAAWCLVGINIFTIILGSLGNLLVCIAVLSTKGMTSSFHYFILSLAAADLVIALVVQPILVVLIIAHINFQCLPDAHLVFRVVGNFACAVSLLTLALIALDRCLIVSPHFDYKNTMTARKKIVLAVIWLLACACSAIRLTIEKEITSYLTAAVFGLCYVEMIVCYAVVYYRISKRRKRPAAMRARTELRGTRHEAAEVQLLKTENIAKERRFARTIVMVLVVFTGGWSYLFYLRLTQPEKNYGIRYDVARTVAFSASAINPALYCFNNKEYRRAFKRILSSFPFGWRREEYERIL
ncbi:alpha-1D adrenergic receptor-like [Orbicella faveolata]|uniref:alpha-1D adrenergic receptor-like n=1 Tax=Orbicella faveolata TaxID=48498 RepID=UPI0009E27F9B|nr:alpha-1D adrenergic receptor-like [Orbicella faveolata]